MKRLGASHLRRSMAAALLAMTALRADAQIFKDAQEVLDREASRQNADAAATVVVYNRNAPDSEDLARFYASKRGIARDQVVGLDCPRTEEITREEYDRTIAEPLRATFTKRGWWTLRVGDDPLGRVEESDIRFVALIRGMPLKVSRVSGYQGDERRGPAAITVHNEASVDAELVVLGLFSRNISGTLNNPYFRAYAPIADADYPSLLLVCRLDAATPATVKRMIVDSIAAEQEGLRGIAYIDARGLPGGGLGEGDKWLLTLANDARRRGTPVILDNGEGVFPTGYPMRHAGLYFGWYADNVAGPMTRPEMRFLRGAVAVHLHSFSALSLRDPRQHWAAPLLEAGAAATLGNVYEPYLPFTSHLHVFHERLRAGFTFAESSWMSMPVLSWMSTFIGDPLYRPFERELEISVRPPSGEWEAYRAGAKLWIENPAKGTEMLVTSAKKLRSGMIMEGLGLLQLTAGDVAGGIHSFRNARQYFKHPDDILRVSIHEIIQLRATNKEPEALALVRRQLAAFPKSPAVEVLRMLESQLVLTSSAASTSTNASRH